MKLTAKLALSQIKTNRSRSVMTLLGIVLSSAMLTAVCGYVESARQVIYNALGYGSDAPLHFALIAMGAVLGAIIITASVIVVSNAFRISASERTRQFGILKSVGATKKQIAVSVLYEGVFLSVIGIPIGIAVGLLLELLGTSVITNLLQSMSSGGTLNVDSDAYLTVPFATPPLMFVVASATSFATVIISAWLPARKAAKISAIDAIRNAGEVKLQYKAVRTPKLTQALFGFEGTLAAKSLKRSRRSFRATVVSLTISIVLLLAAGSFGSLLRKSTTIMLGSIDATASADWISDIEMSYDEEGLPNIDYVSLDVATAESMTEKFREYNNAEVFGLGGIRYYSAKLPDGVKTTSALIHVDRKHYEQLCKIAGVPIGSNLLINLRRENENGIRKEYAPHNFSDFSGKSFTFNLPGHESTEVIINGELKGEDVPAEVINLLTRFGYELSVIVPECESSTYSWFAKVDNVAGFVEYANQILADYAPQSTDEISIYAEWMDIASVMKQLRDLANTIMFFVYGFVGMLTLIAVTSVISTINTNIRSRAREFAVLESIGMTQSGIKKMLNLESILCSVRSLIFGIPLGVIGAYALYEAMSMSVELPFSIPWLLIAECILGVFVVTWITMHYSASKLKNGNIVETIRGE